MHNRSFEWNVLWNLPLVCRHGKLIRNGDCFGGDGQFRRPQEVWAKVSHRAARGKGILHFIWLAGKTGAFKIQYWQTGRGGVKFIPSFYGWFHLQIPVFEVSPSRDDVGNDKTGQHYKRGLFLSYVPPWCKVSSGSQFEYAWCLVRSRYPADIRKGIILLEDLFKNREETNKRDYLYYLSIGNNHKQINKRDYL